MKALTLTQPWASLVALGAKTIETRSWYTEYRGEVALHAAKGFPPDARYFVTEEPFATGLGNLRPAQLPTAVIIAITSILDCWKFTEATKEQIRRRSERGDLPKFEADFGDYSPGRYGFRFGPVTVLRTEVPARGMLNLWNVPAEVERQINSQLAEGK